MANVRAVLGETVAIIELKPPVEERVGARISLLLVTAGFAAWPIGRLLLEFVLQSEDSGGTLLLGFGPLAQRPADYLAQAVGIRILVSATLVGLGLLAALWPRLSSLPAPFAAADRLGAVLAVALGVLLAVIYLPAGSVWYPSHDFLDSEFVYKALRGQSPGWFDLDHSIASLMGGIPLSAFGFSDLNPLVNLYVVLDPFLAFTLSEIVSRLTAFAGMYLLLSRHVLVGRVYPAAIPGSVALLFALLPYWEHQTATIAFQPLHIVSLLALRAGASRLRWLPVAVIYPLVADGLRGGLLLVGAPLLMAALDVARGRQAEARNLVVPSVVTGGLALLSLIRPAHLILATDFVSHRSDWPVASAPVFHADAALDFISELGRLLIFGQYHMGGGPFLLPIISAALVLTLARPSQSVANSTVRAGTPLALVLTTGILIVSVISAAEESGFTNMAGAFPIPLRISRIIAFAPLLWMLVLAWCMTRLAQTGRKGLVRLLLIGVVVQATVGAFGLIPKLTGGRAEPLGSASSAGPPSHMRDYFRLEQFEAVASTLGENAVVVSFDIDPMIAAFNGIATLDGYAFNYPIEHKRRFRTIIAEELNRDPGLRRYFDDFGSRAYLFFSEHAGGEFFIDFCAAAAIGATHVIARGPESSIGTLVPVGRVGDLTVHRIAEPCGDDAP